MGTNTMIGRKILKSEADRFLFWLIVKELMIQFNLSKSNAKKMVLKSDFISFLAEEPEEAQHMDPTSWAIEILRKRVTT